MSCCGKIVFFCLLGPGLLGCREKPAPSEERTEPWPAPAVSSASAPSSALVTYQLADKQKIEFELQTKSTKIVGYFPVLKGKLEFDLMQLQASKGNLDVDLGAVRIESDDEQEHRSYSATASNWLNLGSSIPEAKRASRRWANFQIGEVFETSVQAAHEGKVERRAKNTPDPDSDAAAVAPSGEIRKVFAKLAGPFSMNERRMSQDMSVSLAFTYPAQATPGFPPDEVVVSSTKPLRISLEAYGIKPRNATGVVVASDLKLLGTTVGRIARVSFSLTFRHQPKAD